MNDENFSYDYYICISLRDENGFKYERKVYLSREFVSNIDKDSCKKEFFNSINNISQELYDHLIKKLEKK